jgi:hypothetical protein
MYGNLPPSFGAIPGAATKTASAAAQGTIPLPPGFPSEPQREIPREFEALCQQMNYLEDMANQLIQRLSPILMKRPGEAESCQSAQAPIGTVFGNDIYCLNRRIGATAERLNLAAQDLAI